MTAGIQYTWLDHCICTADADEIIANIDILYDCATTDHIPFHVVCDIDCLPVLSNEINNCSAGLDWSRLSGDDIQGYCNETDLGLSKLVTPNVALTCANVHCKDNSHTTDLNNMYNDIVCCLEKAGNNLHSNVKKKKYVNRPGWSE